MRVPVSMPGDVRGILLDGVNKKMLVLFKHCRRVRLTYEIRLATYVAKRDGLALFVACFDPDYEVSDELEAFIGEHAPTVVVAPMAGVS